jgi:hypothetical protein
VNPQAAEELLEVIMCDDYVARRRGLDMWMKRWISELVATHPQPKVLDETYGKESLSRMARAALSSDAVDFLLNPSTGAMRLIITEKESVREFHLTLHVVRQEPYDVSTAAVRPA